MSRLTITVATNHDPTTQDPQTVAKDIIEEWNYQCLDTGDPEDRVIFVEAEWT